MLLSMESLKEAKVGLRERMRSVVRATPPERWAAASALVCARIMELPAWRNARTVMLYHSTPRELSLRDLAEAAERTGRTVCLPRANWCTMELQPARIPRWGEGLTEPKRGIREPVSAALAIPGHQIDLIVVPGVSFDPSGGRLGRGAGFYDRFLASVDAFKVGVCLDEQMVESVPMGENDARLDAVVTPERTYSRGN